jgi:hypothetical protein
VNTTPESGSYKELLRTGGTFAEFLMEHLQEQQVYNLLSCRKAISVQGILKGEASLYH